MIQSYPFIHSRRNFPFTPLGRSNSRGNFHFAPLECHNSRGKWHPEPLREVNSRGNSCFLPHKREISPGNLYKCKSINKILYFNRKNLLTHLLIANIVFLDENHFKSISYFCTKLNSKQQNEELESMFMGALGRYYDLPAPAGL